MRIQRVSRMGIKLACSLFLIVLHAEISEASVTASSVLPLSPDNSGFARFRFMDTNTSNAYFTVGRGTPGQIASCPNPSFETLTYDSANNISWCDRTVVMGNYANFTLSNQGGGSWIYTDKLVGIDAVDTREFKYRVKAYTDGASSYVSIWTASCTIADGQDPLAQWVTLFNQHIGAPSTSPILSLSDIPISSSALPTLTQKTVTLNSHSAIIYIYSNDKYVAVFGPRGTLLGLTNRALGDEFITYSASSSNNVPRDPFYPSWNDYVWLIKYGANTNFNSDLSCPSQSASDISLTYSASGNVVPNINTATGKLTFTWTGLPNGMVVTNTWNMVSTDGTNGSSAGLRGQLAVTGTPDSGGYLCASFPVVTGLGLQSFANTLTPDAIDLTWPSGKGSGPNNSGSLIKSYSQTGASFAAATGNGLQLQFAGLANSTHALYLATEDAANHPKQFVLNNYWMSGGNSNAGGSMIDRYPDTGTGILTSAFTSNYDTVLRPMCGGTSRMAKQYRKWATQQDWTKSNSTARLTSTRTDIAQSVRDGLYWWTSILGSAGKPDGLLNYVQNPQQDTNYINNLKAEIGMTTSGGNVPIGIHLYTWYQETFDQQLPKFTMWAAGSDGITMPQALASIRNDGTMVVPYINTNDIDISDRSPPTYSCSSSTHGWWNTPLTYGPWTNEIVVNDLMQKPSSFSSEPFYIFCSSSQSVLGKADPSLPSWQSMVSFNVGQVLNNSTGLGADGVYLDTFGTGYHPDFNPLHTQHVGHGDWWLAGQTTIGANTVQQAVQAGSNGVRKLTASEYFNEPLMSYSDVIMNYEMPKLSDTPLLWTVYSGYQIYAGGNISFASTDAARMAIQGRNFVWGYQLGLMNGNALCGSSSGLCDPAYPTVAYARKLAQARNSSFLRPYLSYGELLDTADDVSGNMVSYIDVASGGVGAWCDTTQHSGCSDTSGPAPAVRGARWRVPSGGEIIVLTNTTSSPVTATIAIPVTWVSPSVCNADGTGCASAGSIVASKVSVQVAANEIKVLKK